MRKKSTSESSETAKPSKTIKPFEITKPSKAPKALKSTNTKAPTALKSPKAIKSKKAQKAQKANDAAPKRTPSYLNFDKDGYAWKPDIDYRREPELYRVGKGEQGVLICQPYKSELVPLWKFKTPPIARTSSRSLTQKFADYLANDDFVGADLTRKFLQMGFTRARRYANYKGGRKYDKENSYEQLDKGTGDPLKAESAAIFFKAWKKAEANKAYSRRKKEWIDKFG